MRGEATASPATGGRCPLGLGEGAGPVPRDGKPRPQDAPPLGATKRLPAAWLNQRATCHTMPCHSRLLAELLSVHTCWTHLLPYTRGSACPAGL